MAELSISHRNVKIANSPDENTSAGLPKFSVFMGWLTFYFIAGLFTHVFGGEEEQGILSGLFTPITFVLYVTSVLLLLSKPYRDSLQYYLRQNWWHWLALAVIVLSVIWSVEPDATLRRSVALLGTTASGLLVGFTFSKAGMVKSLRRAFLVLLLISVLLAIVLPQYGTHPSGKFEGVWRGILPFKNQFGWLVAIFIVLWSSMIAVAGRYLMFWVLLLVGLYSLTMSASATGLVVTTFGLTLLTLATVYYRARAYRVPIMVLALCVVLAVIPLANDLLDSSLEIVGKDATLTGRTSIWATLWIFIEPNIWLGNGYSAFWSDAARFLGPSNWMVGINHSHNAYIEVLLDNGILGLVTALLFVLSLLSRLHRLASKGDLDARILLTILIATLIIGLAGALLFRPNSMAWLLFIVASAYVSEKSRLFTTVKTL